MTHPTVDWDRIGRVLAGEATADEVAEVERWFAEHPAEAQALRKLDGAARGIRSLPSADVERALRLVKGESRTHRRDTRSPARLAHFAKRIEFLAAAAAVILVAGVFLFRRIESARQPAPEVGYATGVGQRDSVTLADGSMVLLGPSSRVTVRGGGRDVQLVGEAFFRVNHDAALPFVVRAGSAVVRDIGTAFTVQGDATRPVRVVVTEGVVALTHGTDSVTLQNGDIGVVRTDGAVVADRGAATADDTAWMLGRLVFRDASLDNVGEDLRRWFGVQLVVTDSLLRRRVFTGSFGGDSPARVLEAVGLALGARVQYRGDTAFLGTSTVK